MQMDTFIFSLEEFSNTQLLHIHFFSSDKYNKATKKKKKKKRVQLLLPYHQLNKGQHNRHYFGMTVMYKFWLSYVKDENGDISHFTGIDSPINVIIKKWITQTPT